MRFVSLASGSKGNCTLIDTDRGKILVDCGITAKRAGEELKAIGLTIEDIDAVLLTHEHSDHIKGLKRLMSAYHIPVYGSGGTLRNLSRVTGDEYFDFAGREYMNELQADHILSIKGVDIVPFRIYHDVAEPFGYRMELRQEKGMPGSDVQRREQVSVSVLTDCGHFDDMIVDHICQTDAMVLEANHDRGMLANGPYPMMLKRRIMSRDGHLSNNASGQLLSEVLSTRLRHVLLGHLSFENNTHQLAMDTVRNEVKSLLGEQAAKSLSMSVAPQDGLSVVIEL